MLLVPPVGRERSLGFQKMMPPVICHRRAYVCVCLATCRILLFSRHLDLIVRGAEQTHKKKNSIAPCVVRSSSRSAKSTHTCTHTHTHTHMYPVDLY